MRRQPVTLRNFLRSVFAHRQLILRLAKREIAQRFRGSMLGLGWMPLTPLLTAAVFTFVFSAVFQTRWGGTQGGPFDFAILLLAGFAVHSIFAEAMGRAPTLILTQSSYVTKVVFPIEILPVIAVLSSVISAFVTICIIVLGQAALKGVLHWTIIFWPLVVTPLLTSIVEQSRTVIVFGGLPDVLSLAIYTACALLSLALAFWMFQRLRPGFADVL